MNKIDLTKELVVDAEEDSYTVEYLGTLRPNEHIVKIVDSSGGTRLWMINDYGSRYTVANEAMLYIVNKVVKDCILISNLGLAGRLCIEECNGDQWNTEEFWDKKLEIMEKHNPDLEWVMFKTG
jgi:hypothetical protein